MSSSVKVRTNQKRKSLSSEADDSNVNEVAAVPVVEDPQKLKEELEMQRKKIAELKKKLEASE
eukprot:scaffold122656_cov24-Attheya_sp.AAC.1